MGGIEQVEKLSVHDTAVASAVLATRCAASALGVALLSLQIGCTDEPATLTAKLDKPAPEPAVAQEEGDDAEAAETEVVDLECRVGEAISPRAVLTRQVDLLEESHRGCMQTHLRDVGLSEQTAFGELLQGLGVYFYLENTCRRPIRIDRELMRVHANHRGVRATATTVMCEDASGDFLMRRNDFIGVPSRSAVIPKDARCSLEAHLSVGRADLAEGQRIEVSVAFEGARSLARFAVAVPEPDRH